MLKRHLAARLAAASGEFPATVITGPRQSGKTTLARETFPNFAYVSLEDIQNRAEARSDPRGFLRHHHNPHGLIIDEVQHSPEILSALQQTLDERAIGPVVLTGSQNLLLSQHINQSLAGRTAIFELLPLSMSELAGHHAIDPAALSAPVPAKKKTKLTLEDILFRGLYPRLHASEADPILWLDSYVRTYVERDVRMLANIGNLDAFARFVALCAGRSGQLVNTASLGADAGVSHTTARQWLSLLEASYLIAILRPHHTNFGKRLIKAPKLHFLDTGVMCRLLGIRSAADVLIHPLRGAIFESFVVSELRKLFLNRGERPPLFFFRDSNGLEVDVIVDLGVRRIPIEIKSGETIASDAFRALDTYLRLDRDSVGVLVHGGGESYMSGRYAIRAWSDVG